MPNTLHKLLVKATLQRKGMRQKGNKASEERETRLQWMSDWQQKSLKGEITVRETEDYSRQGPTSTQSYQLKPEEK